MHVTSDYIHPYKSERVSRCLSAGEQGDTDGSQTTRRCSWRRGPGTFRKNPNPFPSDSGVLKLLVQMYGVRHRNTHKTQPDARRRDEGSGEEDTMRDTGTVGQTPSTRTTRRRVPTSARRTWSAATCSASRATFCGSWRAPKACGNAAPPSSVPPISSGKAT
jgi:hypothetical protein